MATFEGFAGLRTSGGNGASSAEPVGEFRLGQIAKCMIPDYSYPIRNTGG